MKGKIAEEINARMKKAYENISTEVEEEFRKR